jgi:hypothetical protein
LGKLEQRGEEGKYRYSMLNNWSKSSASYLAMNGRERQIMKDRTWLRESGMSGKWERFFVVTLLIGAFIGTLIVVNGCAVVPGRRRVRTVAVRGPDGSVDVVYVQKAPPKPKAEVRPRKPNPKAVWIPGYWRWAGGKYVWTSGHWDTNPRGKTWVPGHWEKRPGGWVWVSGRWR